MNPSSDRLVESLAQRIARWRLQAPAAVLLEAHKPLGFLASQCVLLSQPVLDTFLSHDISSELVVLLQDRRRLEDLIIRLTANRSGDTG